MLSPFCKVDWIRPQSQRAGAQSPRETAAFETSGRPASVCFLDNCLFSFPGKAWTIVFYRIFSSLVLDLDISSQLTCFVWEMHLNKLMKPLLRMNPFRLLTEKFWKGNIITDKKKKKNPAASEQFDIQNTEQGGRTYWQSFTYSKTIKGRLLEGQLK